MVSVDCIVIGGGVAGLLAARELARSGMTVCLLERNADNRECSWAGGGILSPLYPWREPDALNELAAISQKLYPVLAQELLDCTGIDPEWVQCGMLSIGVEDRKTAEVWAITRSISCKVMETAHLDSTVDALWLPAIAQIRNPRLIAALWADLAQRGVKLFKNTNVNRLHIRNGRVQAVETGHGNFRAAVTVIATGVWTSELLPDVPIRPVRGQMLCYRAPAADRLEHIKLKNGFYLIPRKDGHILAGSTVEEVGFDRGTTDTAKNLIARTAEELLPGINRYPLAGHWSGLRPAAGSNLPYVTAHPDIDGLYLNTGHHRNGILLAAGSARLLTDIILGRTPAIPLSPFAYRGINEIPT